MTGTPQSPASPEPSPARHGISVFFPFYNEEANIETVTIEAIEFLPEISGDFEVILVDDGSSDGTGAIADRLAADHAHVRVLHHPTNRGYGAALRTGFAAATKELVFYTDGDGQFDIRELALLLPHIDTYDIVSGYRMDRRDSLVRKVNAFCWGKLVTRLLGFRCRDVDSAFKLYRREIFNRIELRSTGALIDAEVLARAVRAGCRLTEVPVHHRPRLAGTQTGANLKVILRAFRELLKLRKDIRSTPSA